MRMYNIWELQFALALGYVSRALLCRISFTNARKVVSQAMRFDLILDANWLATGIFIAECNNLRFNCWESWESWHVTKQGEARVNDMHRNKINKTTAAKYLKTDAANREMK